MIIYRERSFFREGGEPSIQSRVYRLKADVRRRSAIRFYLWVTFLTRTAAFLCLPFLTVFLLRKGMSPEETGWILGIGWVAGAAGGVIAGYLADRLGSPRVFSWLLLLWGTSFAGFSSATTFWGFLGISLLNGFCRSSIDNVLLAHLTQLVPERRRTRVLAAHNWALNLGMAVGPAGGSLLALSGSEVFLWTGGVFGLVWMFHLLRRAPPPLHPPEPVPSPGSIAKVMVSDRSLLRLILAAFFFFAAYAQIESTLPMVLKQESLYHLYPWLLFENALIILLFSIPLMRRAEKHSPVKVYALGCFLFVLGFLCFARGGTFALVFGMEWITLGEIFIFPMWRNAVVRIAGNLKATYLGAANAAMTGFFLGPVLGTHIFVREGAEVLFTLFAAMGLCTLFFYQGALRRFRKDGERLPGRPLSG